MPSQDMCAYCGIDESLEKMNREHFVPRCLWADQKPVQMKTVPAHITCNKKYASDAEYFRDVLVSEEGNNHPEAIKLRRGELDRKMENRFGAMINTYHNVRLVDVKTSSGVIVRRAPVFEVDRVRIERLLTNTVNGCFYTLLGRPISQHYTISILTPKDFQIPQFASILANLGKVNHFGDDVFQCRALTDNVNNDNFACLMSFYAYKVYLGVATPADNPSEPKTNERTIDK